MPSERDYAAMMRGGYPTAPYLRPESYSDYGRGGVSMGELLGYRGQLEAERQRGGLGQLGQTIAQAGQQLGQALQQKQEKEEASKRETATFEAIQAWDGKDPLQLYAGLRKIRGPAGDAMGYTNTVLAMRKGEQKDPEQEAKRFGTAARWIDGHTDEEVQMAWPFLSQSFGPTAPKLFGGPLPEQWDPKFRGVIKPAADMFGPKRTLRERDPAKALIDEEGNVVSAATPKPAEGKVVETVDAQGRPVTREAAPDELRAGVPKYVPPPAPREPKEDRILSYTTMDHETGEPVQGYRTESQAREMARTGATSAKPETAATQNRRSAARTSIEVGEGLLKRLQDPKFTSQIGPAQGRYNSLMAAVGAGDPEAQRLVGEIRSFAALQPQIHGFRAVQMAHDVERLLSTKQTPESLAAGLKGILAASYAVAGQQPSGEAPQIKDAADFARLPSGAVFIDPSGKRRRKP